MVLIITSILSIALGLFVLANNHKRLLNWSFFFFSLFLSLWIVNIVIISSEFFLKIPHFIDLIARLPYSLIMSFAVAIYFFAKEFPARTKEYSKYDKFIIISGVVSTIISLSSLVVDGMSYDNTGAPIPSYGPLFLIFPIFFLSAVFSILVIFFKKRKLLNALQLNQLKLFILGFSLFIFGAVTTNLLLPALFQINDLFVFGPLFLLLFIGLVAYSIVRYRAMDIRLVITRSLVYALLVSFVTGSFVAVTYLGSEYISAESQIAEIAILAVGSLLIVLLLEPLKKLLARATNRIFFKAAINYDLVTKRITNVINDELELDKLVTRFTEELEKDLRLRHAVLLLPVGEGVYMAPEELLPEDRPQGQSNGMKTNTIANTPLLQHLHENRQEVVVIDEVDRKVADAKTSEERERYDQMRTSMEEMHAYAAIPIPSTVSQNLEAILLLSRKRSGDPFSSQDIQLLEVIAPQIASGIQKARLFQEAKQFNVKLQREVEKATKDLREANEKLTELDRAKSEFMSIASHQLRTPLAGIIGYLSMMEDGDFGEINEEQKPIIHDVVNATQRLIRMVNIFLNVTRIEAGRFVMNYTKQPFADVIEAIYKELKPTADAKGVKLIYKKKKLPEVEVDADKIKDVILNLVDNAIKYSPKGRVEVLAEANTRSVHVMIKDSGVGIAPEEAKNLFSKFVRGSGIARVEPNGSGLGLFIAKKITEGHGGKIWAESEGEGKGSTFQFRIPIKANKEAKQKAEEFKKRAKK